MTDDVFHLAHIQLLDWYAAHCTNEAFEQEIHFFQEALIEAVAQKDLRFDWEKQVPKLYTRFEALARDNLVCFRLLCGKLLEDERREVRIGVMKLLSAYRKKDDVLSAFLLASARKQKDTRREALNALMAVYTRRWLAHLFVFAEAGYSSALYMVGWSIQTPEEIERGIAIARKYIGAKEYRLREAALFLLQRYSTVKEEGERVLAVVHKYYDELFIHALKQAPPDMVLEPLKAPRSEKSTPNIEIFPRRLRCLSKKSAKPRSKRRTSNTTKRMLTSQNS